MARRRRKGAGAGWALLLLVAVVVPVVIWGPGLLRDHSYQLTTERCTATHGEYVDYKTAEQVGNAAIIAAVGMSYGFDEYGVTVAIATAIQESSLRNLNWGDRDSLGLFQQRPSQGWGTEEEVTDPHYAASKFYQALERVAGWRDMALTEAAQAVQRSGFPEAYADHEREAAAWAAALTGGDAVIDCRVDAKVTSGQAFAERLHHDFGSGRYLVEAVGGSGGQLELAITPVVHEGSDAASLERASRAVLEWAVATARSTGVSRASMGEHMWENGKGRSVIEVPEPTDGEAPQVQPVIVRISVA